MVVVLVKINLLYPDDLTIDKVFKFIFVSERVEEVGMYIYMEYGPFSFLDIEEGGGGRREESKEKV